MFNKISDIEIHKEYLNFLSSLTKDIKRNS